MADRDTSPATLDADQFASLVESLGDELTDVIEMFRDLALVDADEVARASAVADHDAVHAAAHRLKGSSMTLGAARLAELCAEILDATRAGLPAASAVAALPQEIAVAHDAMRRAAAASG